MHTHTHTCTHTHAHTCTHQHTHFVYFKLIVIITPQMSYYQRTLPMSSGHSQSSQVTCGNKPSLSHFSPLCLLENTPQLLFWGYISPATLLSSFPHLPPLPNSMSISQKRAGNKIFKSVQFIFELSGQSHPSPFLGVLLVIQQPHASPSRLPSKPTSRKDSHLSLTLWYDCILTEDTWASSPTRSLPLVPQRGSF